MLRIVDPTSQGLAAALALLDCWNLTVSAKGELLVKPWRRAISLGEFGVLVKRMAVEIQPGNLSLIVFDFTSARMASHAQFVCANLVQALGHRLGTPCVLFPAHAA